MLDNIALFNGMKQGMDYMTVRQRVIAQNISNADTPYYKAHAVNEPNFKKTMNRYMGGALIVPEGKKLLIEKTDSSHIAERRSVGRRPNGVEDRETYEVKPSRNAVVLEEQMIEGGENMSRYQLVTGLYQRHVGMLKSATTSGR
jgi:flagellar basal-body rod protein FlgB